MSETFAIIYTPGSAWLPGKSVSEQPLHDHVGYLLGLHKAGKLVMGGPFSDSSGGLVVLEVTGVDEAQRLIAQDPAIVANILTAKVYKWDRIV